MSKVLLIRREPTSGCKQEVWSINWSTGSYWSRVINPCVNSAIGDYQRKMRMSRACMLGMEAHNERSFTEAGSKRLLQESLKVSSTNSCKRCVKSQSSGTEKLSINPDKTVLIFFIQKRNLTNFKPSTISGIRLIVSQVKNGA